ncbi:MAG: hydroxymethylglutaryl-CoA synthase family protein [Methylomicrobium sp.]
MNSEMSAVGIEKMRVYPGSMTLDMRMLVEARGGNMEDVCGEMMITQRSVNPPWEDPVTMAVNAARDLLSDEDRRAVKLLLVASESAPDQEKALSTWVQRFLELPDDCRNLEVKHACYGGTAALNLALAWLHAEADDDDKALVICTDQSRTHFNKPYEYVMGAGAVAMLLSRKAGFFILDRGLSGLYTHEVSDLIRPTSRVEAGHSETSLLSYMDAVDTAFQRYRAKVAGKRGVQLDTLPALREWFFRQIYHAPFGGITCRAHRSVMRTLQDFSAKAVATDYEERVLPSLSFNRRMGGTYAGSVFISLLTLAGEPIVRTNPRIGIYSYGSGSTGEFYSGCFGHQAKAVAVEADLAGLLDARLDLTLREYEEAERERTCFIDYGDFQVSLSGFRDLYAKAYEGQGKLVFLGAREHIRQYRFS